MRHRAAAAAGDCESLHVLVAAWLAVRHRMRCTQSSQDHYPMQAPWLVFVGAVACTSVVRSCLRSSRVLCALATPPPPPAHTLTAGLPRAARALLAEQGLASPDAPHPWRRSQVGPLAAGRELARSGSLHASSGGEGGSSQEGALSAQQRSGPGPVGEGTERGVNSGGGSGGLSGAGVLEPLAPPPPGLAPVRTSTAGSGVLRAAVAAVSCAGAAAGGSAAAQNSDPLDTAWEALGSGGSAGGTRAAWLQAQGSGGSGSASSSGGIRRMSSRLRGGGR